MVATAGGQLTWQNQSTGDITGVEARNGLTGGGTSGDVYIDVNTGTGLEVSGDAVQLTSSYSDGSAYDSRFVNEGQSGSVTAGMIGNGQIDAPAINGSSKFQFKEVYIVDSTVADSILLTKGTLDDSYFTLSDFDGSSIDTTASGQLQVKAGGVTTTEIATGTILFTDIDDNDAGSGQVMKYNGSIWSHADDETGGWVDDGSSIRLETSSDDVGIGIASPAARLHVENLSLTASESAVEVDFGTSTSDIGTRGITVESATLTNKGALVAVNGVSSIDRGANGLGTTTGRLGASSTWAAYDQFTGVWGHSNASNIGNLSGQVSHSLGGWFRAQPASAMTLDALGTYYVGGIYGEVGGEINASSNSIISGVIGVDNSTGTGTSFAGYFEGDVYASGDVGIGKKNPSYELDVNGDIGCVTLHESSDARLKADVSQLTGVLDKIEQIRGVSFKWNDQARVVGAIPGEKQIGVIAQELETVFPELVSSSENGYKSVDYAKLTAVLIEAVKEQQKSIDELRRKAAETEDLRTQINDLQTLVETLLAQKGTPEGDSDELAVSR